MQLKAVGAEKLRAEGCPSFTAATTQCRRVATRCEKLAANYLAFISSQRYGCGFA